MALTRKSLKAMGLTEEQVDSIIELHLEVKSDLEEQIKGYKADALRLKEVEKELDSLKKGDGKDYKKLYEDEKAAHSKTKDDYAAKETSAANERLFRAQLTEIGISGKRADQIVKMTDLTQFETENGAYKDATAVQEHILTEWSEFVPTTTTRRATVDTPPGNGGGKKYSSREEIMKIADTQERQAAIQANPDLF